MTYSRLIVNADDFGYSEAVNNAIMSAFGSDLLTSTSIMANMPGFDHAVGLARRHSFLHGKIGLHLNLTEGYPLSPTLMDCAIFCGEDGRLIYDRGHPLFRLGRRERNAVYEEFRLQFERVLAAGIRPTHLDSHHHVHTEWAIAPLVCRLAHDYGIRRIRLTRNIGPMPSRAKRLYKKVFNSWFLGRPGGLADNTDYFGNIGDMNYFLDTEKKSRRRETGDRPLNVSFEIMVHPLFDSDGRLVDLDGKDLREGLREFRPIDL